MVEIGKIHTALVGFSLVYLCSSYLLREGSWWHMGEVSAYD